MMNGEWELKLKNLFLALMDGMLQPRRLAIPVIGEPQRQLLLQVLVGGMLLKAPHNSRMILMTSLVVVDGAALEQMD